VPRSAEHLDQRPGVAPSRLRSGRTRSQSQLFLLWLAGVVLFGLLPAHSKAGVAISDVRVWPAPEYTRITIESNKAIEYTVFTAKSPERLVLDLEGVTLDAGLEGLPARIGTDDPYIVQARVARNRPGVVRVVLEVRGEVKPQAFSLQPVGSYAHRLVVDIYPAHSVDPILTLLQQIDKDKTGAAQPPAAPSETAPPANDPRKDVDDGAVASGGRQVAASGREQRQADPEPARSPEKVSSAKEKSRAGGVRPVTIAIDAGHGGEDPGAKGRNGTYEKDVTLAIARKLKTLVDAEPNMRGILVRDGDYFVELKERVNKARKMRADLFVSIHADAYNKPHARGSSVFALSERGATSVVAGWLAKKENEADLIGGVNLDVRDPYVKQVLLDLSQTATINDSIQLGRSVLAEIGGINTLHKARVEQAGFAVLKAPDIPSILVETAFISNPSEETRLCKANYQEQLAAAMLQGIRKYFARNPPSPRDKIAANP
jgi:N-acetylmuramoyl-L-alanine amidase